MVIGFKIIQRDLNSGTETISRIFSQYTEARKRALELVNTLNVQSNEENLLAVFGKNPIAKKKALPLKETEPDNWLNDVRTVQIITVAERSQYKNELLKVLAYDEQLKKSKSSQKRKIEKQLFKSFI